jgi:hypothetical protein
MITAQEMKDRIRMRLADASAPKLPVNHDCKPGDRLLVNGISVFVVDSYPNGVKAKHVSGNVFVWNYADLLEWGAQRFA